MTIVFRNDSNPLFIGLSRLELEQSSCRAGSPLDTKVTLRRLLSDPRKHRN